MQSNTNGTEIVPFFVDHMRNKRSLPDDGDQSCNCALYPTIEKTFTIDHSDPTNRFKLIYIDTVLSSILSVDQYSCRCDILLNISGDHRAQTVNTLKSDFNRMYWTTTDDDYLYVFNKRTNNLEKFPQQNSGDILIYGQHTQPYPPQKCLLPKFNDNLIVSLVAKMSDSLILRMPRIDVDEDCRNVSTGTVEYKVYYMPYSTEDDLQCDETCAQISTFNDELTITGLRPFSKYVFSLSVSNFYSNVGSGGSRIRIGPGTVIKTAVGGEFLVFFSLNSPLALLSP